MPSANVAEMFNIPVGGRLSRTSSPLLITDSEVGIEVEVEGLTYNREYYQSYDNPVQSHWNVVRDGSLRGGNSAEFVFKEPMFGTDVIDALNVLYDSIGDIPFSTRTSVHVHLDVRDMSYSQLLNLVIIYLLVEPILFSLVKQERVENPYCAPLRACGSYLSGIRRCLSSSSSDGYFSSLGNSSGNKYTALNLLPMATQGSIEFRHKEGTTDISSITQWVNVILALKKYATSCGEVSSIQSICNMVDNYVVFVKEVFRGVEIDNLEELARDHEYGAGICAKTMMSEGDESILLGALYDKSALFWDVVSESTLRVFDDYQEATLDSYSRHERDRQELRTRSAEGHLRTNFLATSSPSLGSVTLGHNHLNQPQRGE